MKVRLIDKSDAVACNDFNNRIYGKQRSLEKWRWEFLASEIARQQIPYAVVDDDGTIAGSQALIPIRMIDSDGVYWTAKSEETIVDPAYRGKKLFEQMYELLFNYAREHDLRAIWGFTPATKAFRRLGFVTPAVTRQLFFPLSTRLVPVLFPTQSSFKRFGYGLIAAIAGRVSAIKLAMPGSPCRTLARNDKLELRTLGDAPGDAGELCHRFIEQFGGKTIYRDADYLHWRFFSNPYCRAVMRGLYYNDRLLGWVAFAMGDDGMGYLVDILVAEDHEHDISAGDAVSMLLREAVVSLRQMGAVAVRGWSVTDHPFDRMVRQASHRLGFFHLKRGHTVVLYTTGGDQGKPDSVADWYISRAYTEGMCG